MPIVISKCDTPEGRLQLKEFYDGCDTATTNQLRFDFAEGYIFFNAVLDNEVIGIASVANDTYSYEDFKRFVLQEYRHTGVGNELLNYIINDARECGKIRITGYIKNISERAIDFFSGKGFKIVPSTREATNSFSFLLLDLRKLEM